MLYVITSIKIIYNVVRVINIFTPYRIVCQILFNIFYSL